MKKLIVVTFAALLGLSLSVSAGRYDDRQTANRDARSAVKGIHDRNQHIPRQRSKPKHRSTTANKHRSYHGPQGRVNNHGGFNRDYRDNRHFDNSYVVTRPRHSKGPYRQKYHNYSYGDWRHDSRRYHSQWRTYGHTFYYYEPYRYDRYRYRPLRGLGHYFARPGFGYGHWHEGYWCDVYHEPRFYINYYSHYPYHNGWRVGDGDFGIWFRF